MKLECFFGNRDDRFAATGSRQSVSRHRLTDGFEQRPNRAPSPGGTQHFGCSNAQLVTAHVLHGRCRYHRPHPFISYTAAAFFTPHLYPLHTHTHTHTSPACLPAYSTATRHYPDQHALWPLTRPYSTATAAVVYTSRHMQPWKRCHELTAASLHRRLLQSKPLLSIAPYRTDHLPSGSTKFRNG